MMIDEVIKAARKGIKSSGMTRTEFARLAGLSPDALRGYEAKTWSPRANTLRAVQRALRKVNG